MNKIMRRDIPKGESCKGCPWHGRDKNRHKKDNGYCQYLMSADWEHNSAAIREGSKLADYFKRCGENV